MKRRFRVLSLPQEYPIETQVQLVSALVVVHNFICLFDPRDKDINKDHIPTESNDNIMADGEDLARADDRGDASRRRDDITQVIWRDYKARSCRR
jgi:hypothetical protein